ARTSICTSRPPLAVPAPAHRAGRMRAYRDHVTNRLLERQGDQREIVVEQSWPGPLPDHVVQAVRLGEFWPRPLEQVRKKITKRQLASFEGGDLEHTVAEEVQSTARDQLGVAHAVLHARRCTDHQIRRLQRGGFIPL